MPACEIRLEGITKKFGRITAVDHFNFTFSAGKFCSLVGPSGCGKTTTLRMIAGLERQTSGKIFFGEKDVTNVSPRNREVSMVFQSYALYPHMNIRQNLSYGLKKRKIPKQEIKHRIESIAEMLGIKNFLDRKPKQLSGGQQQRVALGRAIVRDSNAFLLDEPLSNLDAKLRARMRAEIATLQRRLGHTMIYVTHDQIEAMSMSDEIVLMDGGKIMQNGPPLELFENPQNMFVAGFIGTPAINFIPVDIQKENNVLFARLKRWKIDLPKSFASSITKKNKESLILGIRPEHIIIDPKSNEEKSIGAIRVVEPVGSEMIVHIDIEGHDLVVKCPTNPSLRPTESVGISVISDKIHLFDPKTEESIIA